MKTALSGTITAYHCGHDIGSGRFSTRYLGTGEGSRGPGYHALGPGIYFATEEGIARRYCKYVRNPYLYEVQIKTSRLYNSSEGKPRRLREILEKTADEVAAERGLGRRYVSHLKYGQGAIGELAFMLGKREAAQKLVKIGVQGAWMKLPAGGLEIAVFDPSIIKIVSKEPQFEGDPMIALDDDELEALLEEAQSALSPPYELYEWEVWAGAIEGMVKTDDRDIEEIEEILQNLLESKGYKGFVVVKFWEDEGVQVKMFNVERPLSSRRVAARWVRYSAYPVRK